MKLSDIEITKQPREVGRSKRIIAVCLTPEILTVVDEIAAERKVSRSLVIENALMEFSDVLIEVQDLTRNRVFEKAESKHGKYLGPAV